MPTIVTLREAKRDFSRLVERANAGEEIHIALRGKPVAMLSRIPVPPLPIPWDVFKGQMEMAVDFDSPLDEFKDYL